MNGRFIFGLICLLLCSCAGCAEADHPRDLEKSTSIAESMDFIHKVCENGTNLDIDGLDQGAYEALMAKVACLVIRGADGGDHQDMVHDTLTSLIGKIDSGMTMSERKESVLNLLGSSRDSHLKYLVGREYAMQEDRRGIRFLIDSAINSTIILDHISYLAVLCDKRDGWVLSLLAEKFANSGFLNDRAYIELTRKIRNP